MSTREELIADLQRRRYWRNFAAYNLVDSSLAEDAVQDVAVIACRSLPEAHPNPLGWLTLTLKRHCWALNRRVQTLPYSDAEDELAIEDTPAGRNSDPLHRVEQRESLREVGEAMEGLKHGEAQALFERMEGHSMREIGEMHGWTMRKVERCLYEGDAALREAVA